MSVLEAVLVKTNYAEAEDMSEDRALTKEFVRFANLQLGTKHRALDTLLKELFKG